LKKFFFPKTIFHRARRVGKVVLETNFSANFPEPLLPGEVAGDALKLFDANFLFPVNSRLPVPGSA